VFRLACRARQILIHHQGAPSRVIVRVKLDTTITQVYAGIVPRENSRSRSATRRAATVQQENIRPRLVSRPQPRASCARQANTAIRQDEQKAACYVPQANFPDNKEQKLQGSVRTVPQTRHRLQVARKKATAQSSAHQDGLDRLGACTLCPIGTHKTETGVGSCLPCPKNSHSSQEGQSLCTCNAGYERVGGAGGVCQGCVAGKYKETHGDGVCSRCDAGSFSLEIGVDITIFVFTVRGRQIFKRGCQSMRRLSSEFNFTSGKLCLI
jgi:hypothetical protein